MSSASRKVKNPLLSAAGEGFPFENYAENTFLVPVTPATPAVLRDDAEASNFVGQEQANSHNSAATATVVEADSEFTPVSLNPVEIKGPETSQPQKQGYLTSILSSLPNLSLSSITGDTLAPQVNQGPGNAATVPDSNPYVPLHENRDSLRDASPPIVPNFHDPRRLNLASQKEVNPGSLPAPPQPTLPPTVPSSSNGPISYRLGNQRRLKYAPPPDLATSTSKQYISPADAPLLTPHNAPTPTIFNPNQIVASPPSYRPVETPNQTIAPPPSYRPVETPNQTVAHLPSYRPVETPISTNSASIQRTTPEYLSQANSLQESFRSSPIAVPVSYGSTGTSRSITPQSQTPSQETVSLSERSNVPLSSSQPIPSQVVEPATPQNTPAQVSFFGFDSYASQRDFPLRTFNTDKDTVESKIGISQAGPPVPILKDGTVKPILDTKPTVSFAPVSAVQVSEKLEHLLAEQKEDSRDLSGEVATKSEALVEAPTGESAVRDESLNTTDGKNQLQQGDQSNSKLLGQQTSESWQSTASQETRTTGEKLDTGERHGVSPNVQTTSQYYQSQQFTSNAEAFAPQSVERRRSLNHANRVCESTVASVTLANSTTTFAQPASSFFYAPENTAVFPPLQKRESNVPAFVDVAPPRNDFQQVPLTSSVNSSFLGPSVSHSVWGGSQSFDTVSCEAPVQPPPPLFYNPGQFQSELIRQPPVNQPYIGSSGVNQTISQPQHYFENTAGPHQTYDITGGIGSGFLPPPSVLTSLLEPTGSATLSPVQMSINPLAGRSPLDSVPPSFQNLAAGPSEKRMQYRGLYQHWFYRKEVENKVLWLPFSMQDSLRLEEVHNSTEITPETTVATDGGRYDVDILRRQRTPVYWNGPSSEVRRCSWFYKGPTESRYMPYDESTAAKLEEEYKQACMSNIWNRRIELSNGEYIIFHSGTVQVHYLTTASPELAASWGNSAGSEDSTYLQGASTRPRVVKRGMDEFHIDEGEPETVDHLLFLVHGIGSVCDLKFRSVEEVVDEFRSISLQLVQSHYRTASEQRIVNRIEVLPISWHTTLHSEDTGIDKKLQAITLESIPKLRHFTNDTLLDILFYTSPMYCQTIMQAVGSEINRLYALFKGRNPNFDGGIYVGGHSLGSLILFDLLCHQKPLLDQSSENKSENGEEEKDEDNISSELQPDRVLKRRHSKIISYVVGAAGTGQPSIRYPQLQFHPRAFFAFGSPIGMFVTVRGIDMLGEDFVLPTCPAFFNIFHPFDPVAYRVEALINSDAPKYRPMLIPHHKGRKRMHLELKETMARVGADLKQKLLDSVRNTWNSVYQLAVFHKTDNTVLEREIDKVVEEQLQQTPTVPDPQTNDDGGAEFKVGKLNGGRRIDYVLQEAPFEYINEYIFALTSHVCYWESEDTMLMMLKEIYGSTGIQTDAQLPQQTLSIERVPPSPPLFPSSGKCDRASPAIPVMGIDPTAPITDKLVGPPPKCGFVRKT